MRVWWLLDRLGFWLIDRCTGVPETDRLLTSKRDDKMLGYRDGCVRLILSFP